MCTTNLYTYVYPDGHKNTSEQAALCNLSRHNKPCNANVVFQHPPQHVAYPEAVFGTSPSSPYLGQFPPTPTYTPRSTTPNYRSGDESDRSRRSSSSSHRRPSGLYINGQKVIDLNRREGNSRRERIVLVDGPPTPRTPPQAFNFPHTAPPSPNTNVSGNAYLGTSPRESSSYSRRPVIVDERPRMERPQFRMEVNEPVPVSQRSTKRERQSSASSRDSRHSIEEEEARRRRQREERRAEKERDEEEERQRRIRLRIAKANAEINKRPAVPVPPAPVRASTFSNKKSSNRDSEEELSSSMKRMTFEENMREDKARRIARKDSLKEARQEERDEEEAQRQRLAERIMPRRRATVGPGSRRSRVIYDDGVYRWE